MAISAEFLKERLVHVAGMSRAGTTYLHHNLGRHPQIFVPTRKELGYFGHNHDEGLGWFLDFFAGLREDQVAFDICGLYFIDPLALDRMRAFHADGRVILGLRKPSEWFFSLYEHYAGIFDVPAPLEFLEGCHIEREGKQIELAFPRGFVRDEVHRYAEAFGDRLLIYDFALLEEDPLALLRAIESFCGVAPHFSAGNFSEARINARGQRRPSWLGRWLQKPGVANAVSRVLPRPLLLRLRRGVELAFVRNLDAPKATPSVDAATLARVREHFAEDDAAVAALFDRERILRGPL